MAEYKIVGYVSKAGKLGTYKHTATAKNKFGEGNRVLLQSFGSEPVKFWVDENKLVAAPAGTTATCRCGDCWICEDYDDQKKWLPYVQQKRSCTCDGTCCARRCSCESHCNCRGGNIFDC